MALQQMKTSPAVRLNDVITALEAEYPDIDVASDIALGSTLDSPGQLIFLDLWVVEADLTEMLVRYLEFTVDDAQDVARTLFGR